MERIRKDEDDLPQRMARLQLPHMPESDSASNDPSSLPSICVMVVADLDLPSAAALAEYALQQRNQVFDASRVDLCIACGPFSRDEDLRKYQSRRQRKQNQTVQQSPFVRSREETAALEGLVTAALSQLENVVCRVVFCPGSTDPLTTILPGEDGRERLRLTPNSRNIHQQWLPLGPSLGCAGLLYLESPEKVVVPKEKNPAQRFSTGEEDDSDKEEKQEDVQDILSEQITGMQQSSEGYCSTLARLLQIAPPVRHPVPFATQQAQTVLVTHYADLDTYQDVPANGSPSWAIEPDQPWPADGHDAFLKSTLASQLLCLEIASGSSGKRPPEWRKHPNGTSVLLPGSLRKRGEFSLVTLSVVPVRADEESPHTDGEKMAETTQFVWKVTSIDNHNIHDHP